MKPRRPVVVGAIVGSATAMLLLAFTSHRPAPTPGPMLGEHGGTIRSVVIQYTQGSTFVWPVYRQFLQQQSADLTVYVPCPKQPDFDELQRAIGPVSCRLIPIFTGHEMTPWSRDRWVELLPLNRGDQITLLAPRGELQQDIWPQRAGDSHIAEEIARFLQPRFVAHRSNLYFDGGDLLCDDQNVFITRAALQRNLQQTVTTRDELIDALAHELRRKVIVMDSAPDHHAGMYMMPAGNHRMLVGDPSLGLPLFDPNTPLTEIMEGGPDTSELTQQHFDAVAKLAADAGYDVRRIPTVPGMNGKQYLTFVNVIMDQRDGRSIVYMPTYTGQSRLNGAAQAVWESLGYDVVPIDCTTTWFRGGTLHCLVNVLEREL